MWMGHWSWGLEGRKDTCGEAAVVQFQALYTCYGMNLECSPGAHVSRSHSLPGGLSRKGMGPLGDSDM